MIAQTNTSRTSTTCPPLVYVQSTTTTTVVGAFTTIILLLSVKDCLYWYDKVCIPLLLSFNTSLLVACCRNAAAAGGCADIHSRSPLRLALSEMVIRVLVYHEGILVYHSCAYVMLLYQSSTYKCGVEQFPRSTRTHAPEHEQVSWCSEHLLAYE